MSYTLPIFVIGEDKLREEFIKGVELRFNMANSTEASKITPVIVEATPDKVVIEQWQKQQGCYVGIAMHSSQEIQEKFENNINDFVLIAPLASAVEVKNVVPLILSEWEANAIKKILERSNFKIEEDVTILTDLDENSQYLSPFKTEITTNMWNFEEPTEGIRAYVIVGSDKWSLIKRLLSTHGDIYVITTSSFEDWQMTPIIRKELSGVHYSYPKLPNDTQKVQEQFENEFGYKPSIISLLAYDGVSIAIKTFLEVSVLTYKKIRKQLFHNVFDLKVTGKTVFPFSEEGVRPLLIGKSPEELFKTKYIDEKGNYKNLTKLGENNVSITS